MGKKEGGFRHQHGPMMARWFAADNPKSRAKSGSLTRQGRPGLARFMPPMTVDNQSKTCVKPFSPIAALQSRDRPQRIRRK
jgi:hypothetical protein